MGAQLILLVVPIYVPYEGQEEPVVLLGQRFEKRDFGEDAYSTYIDGRRSRMGF